jgi:hypothetical protein
LLNSLKSKPFDKSKTPSFRDIVQSRRIEKAEAENEDAIESKEDENEDENDDNGEASKNAIKEDDAA